MTPKKGQHDQLAGIISTLIKSVKSAQDTADASLTVGDIQLKPFRVSELPFGWYFANGDAYELSTNIGKALQSLSSNYKADFGIVTTTATITLPNMFYSDGRGYFLRSVDGITRQVGSVQLDTLQDHAHNFRLGQGYYNDSDVYIPTGTKNERYVSATPSTNGMSTGRIGNETTSLNIGITPAIYLGV